MVTLLAIITAVLYQKAKGNSKFKKFAWLRFTMYALVNPANIINILAIATQRVNLCGCIFFLCSIIATVLILLSVCQRRNFITLLFSCAGYCSVCKQRQQYNH